MTNKQIIIHGIDVSGCKYYDDLDCYSNRDCCGYPEECKDNSSCYYKQYKRLEKLLPDINGKFYKAMDDLKAKEQECEELTSKCSQLKQTLENIAKGKIGKYSCAEEYASVKLKEISNG